MQDQYIQNSFGARVKVKYISKNEETNYQLIGQAIGLSFNHCLAMANANTKGLLSKIVAYSMEIIDHKNYQVNFYQSLGKY